MKQFWSLRRTASREEQVARIERATGLSGFGAVIDYALARVVSGLSEHVEDQDDAEAEPAAAPLSD